MRINEEIKNALRKAIDKAGTQEMLAKQAGLKQEIFSKYLHGKVKSMSLEKWLKLSPYLKEFLNSDYPAITEYLTVDEQILILSYRELPSKDKHEVLAAAVVKAEVKKMANIAKSAK